MWTWLMVEGEKNGVGSWLTEQCHNVDMDSEKFC
jgi:hypothetical protein